MFVRWLRRFGLVSRDRFEVGAATVEFAMTLPAVVGVIVVMVSVALAGATKVEACDTARTAARHYAIVGQAISPTVMSISAADHGQWVTVTATPKAPAVLGPVASSLSCSITAVKEDTHA